MNKHGTYTEQEARYIKVPLPMLRLLIKDKRNISDVITYGVYLTAISQKVSIINATLQLIYVIRNPQNSNGRVSIPSWLKVCLGQLQDRLGLNEDEPELKNGFVKESTDWIRYCPHTPNDEDAQDIVLKYCKENKHFADNVVEFHALRQASELFNFEWLDVDKMQKIHTKYQRFDNDVFCYANIEIMYKYLNDIDKKTDDDIATLLMYMAYKSIIGEKDIVRASNSIVLARMVGAKGRDELEDILAKHPHAKKFYERYSQKEHFNRIKGMVSKYKFIPRINSIPGKAGLGTFVSCDYNISDKEFAEKIKKLVDDERKKKNRERVARYRAKYNLDNDDTGKYLAELFGSSSNEDEPTEILPDLPI